MDAKFYIKSLNNGEGVEGNSKGLFTAYNTPSYIIMRNVYGIDEVNNGQIISIDEFSKLKLQDGQFFDGILVYKEEPIKNDFSKIVRNTSKFYCEFGISRSEIDKIKDSPISFPSNIKDEFGDYYIIFTFS